MLYGFILLCLLPVAQATLLNIDDCGPVWDTANQKIRETNDLYGLLDANITAYTIAVGLCAALFSPGRISCNDLVFCNELSTVTKQEADLIYHSVHLALAKTQCFKLALAQLGPDHGVPHIRLVFYQIAAHGCKFIRYPEFKLYVREMTPEAVSRELDRCLR